MAPAGRGFVEGDPRDLGVIGGVSRLFDRGVNDRRVSCSPTIRATVLTGRVRAMAMRRASNRSVKPLPSRGTEARHTGGTGHAGMQVSFMLKEVEVSSHSYRRPGTWHRNSDRRSGCRAESRCGWRDGPPARRSRRSSPSTATKAPAPTETVPHGSRLPPPRSEPIVPACSRLSMTLARRCAFGHP
jgi:hypothetical protein